MPHKLPIRAKDETYSALTQYRKINHPAKPLDNSNVHRSIKPGTCCKNNIAQILSNTFLFVPMTCWNLRKRGNVSFDWGDAAAATATANNSNNKTPPTRRRSRRTQPQEGTPMPTTKKQQCRQDTNTNNFNDEAPKLRCKQRWWYANNGNNYETSTATMEIIDKILT